MNATIRGENFTITPDLSAYIQQKIAKLRHVAPHNISTANTVDITLVESAGHKHNKYICKAQCSVNDALVTVEEASLNMYASVDIVIARLKTLLTLHGSSAAPSSRGSSRLRRWLTEPRGVS
jgi:ribosomal subunit interface protein